MTVSKEVLDGLLADHKKPENLIGENAEDWMLRTEAKGLRWHRLARSLFGSGLLLYACLGQAQLWMPKKPVEIVVASSAGGGLDVTGRLLQLIIQEKKLVAVPVLVVNKPGAGSAVTWAYVSKFEGDGSYLGVMSNSLLAGKITGRSQFNYTDFTPLAILFSEYIAVMVRPDSPISSAKDLMERLRKDPGALSVGVGAAGTGGPNHTAFASALRAAGVSPGKVRTAIFKSSAEASTALIGGHIDVVPATVASAQPHLKNGTVRVIAVSAPQRLAGAFAGVPTWKENGIDSVFPLWRGVAGPKGLSESQIDYWDKVFAAIMATDEWKRDIEQNNRDNKYLSSKATKSFLDVQYADFQAILGDLGLAR